MTYKIGQLVVNRKLGLGKILEIHGETVTVYFKDEIENPRFINVAAVPMTIASDQDDTSLDNMNQLTRNKKAAARKAARPKAVKAAAAAASA